MARRSFRRNYVAAGIFLIFALLLAVGMSAMLSDLLARLQATTPYRVVFSLEVGTAGLERGSPVSLGGQNIGRVLAVEEGYEDLPDGGRRVVSQIAHIRIREDVRLYENAKITLTLPLFGTVSGLNIRDVGTPVGFPPELAQGGDPLLTEGEMLRGDLAPGLLIQAGFRPEDVLTIRDTIDNVHAVSADARRITENLVPLVTGEGNRVESFLTNLDETSALVRAEAEALSARLGTLFDEAQRVAERIGPAIERAEATLADLQGGAQEARLAVEQVREIVVEQRPRIERIVANVEDITGRVRLESMDQLREFLETGTAASRTYGDLGAEALSLVRENRPEIERAVSNARIASDTLKLTLEEVRAQPWRLLHRPKTKELEQQLLYDAARAYAVAASDLRATSEALAAALRAGDARGELIEDLRGELESQFGAYREAEQALLDRIIQNR